MDRNKQYNFWKNYWNKNNNVNKLNYHKNIGRTKNGQTINNAIWTKTVKDISNAIELKPSNDVLELCCGNGELIGNLANKCKRAVGIDYSEPLINQLKSKYGEKVETIFSDVFDANFNNEEFHHIIIYFAIQHFDELEVVKLIEKYLPILKKGGSFYIGDIPDESRKWNYINKKEYRIDYILRTINQQPKIGYWFHKDFFKAIAEYFKISINIIEQASYNINAAERFDVLLKKK